MLALVPAKDPKRRRAPGSKKLAGNSRALSRSLLPRLHLLSLLLPSTACACVGAVGSTCAADPCPAALSPSAKQMALRLALQAGSGLRLHRKVGAAKCETACTCYADTTSTAHTLGVLVGGSYGVRISQPPAWGICDTLCLDVVGHVVVATKEEGSRRCPFCLCGCANVPCVTQKPVHASEDEAYYNTLRRPPRQRHRRISRGARPPAATTNGCL